MQAAEVRVERAALPEFADAMAARLRAFESGRSFSPARYGNDWGVSFAPAAASDVRASFEAYTPEGSVYLAELSAAGFFDQGIAYTK